jgi:hypothetical protein
MSKKNRRYPPIVRAEAFNIAKSKLKKEPKTCINSGCDELVYGKGFDCPSCIESRKNPYGYSDEEVRDIIERGDCIEDY